MDTSTELTKHQKTYLVNIQSVESDAVALKIIGKLDNEITRWKEIALDEFIQACSVSSGKLDHMCISTYEEAQEMLLEAGLIDKKMIARG